MSLQIDVVLVKGAEFGIEVIQDVFGIEVGEWGRVVFFVVGGGIQGSGASCQRSVDVFHSDARGRC